MPSGWPTTRRLEDDPKGEAAFFLVFTTSAMAKQTGRGLAESEAAVAALVDDLPYFARGWICLMFKATGKRDEAEALWRAIAPHVTRMPDRAPEWVIATVGNAEVCAWLGDARRRESSTTSSRRSPDCMRSGCPRRRTTAPSTSPSAGWPRAWATPRPRART